MSFDPFAGAEGRVGVQRGEEEQNQSRFKAIAGPSVMGVGLATDVIGQMKQASLQRKMTKRQAATQQEALRKQQRGDLGSMLAQAGGMGVGMSSFQDIFNNQTIEDAIQMTSLKQDEQNKLAQIKSQKRAGIAKSIMGTAKTALGQGVPV